MIKIMATDEISNSLITLNINYNDTSEIKIGLLKGTNYVVTKIINNHGLYVIDEDIWRKKHLMLNTDRTMTLEELESYLNDMGYELKRIKE